MACFGCKITLQKSKSFWKVCLGYIWIVFRLHLMCSIVWAPLYRRFDVVVVVRNGLERTWKKHFSPVQTSKTCKKSDLKKAARLKNFLIIQFNKLTLKLTEAETKDWIGLFIFFIIQPKIMMGHICVPCVIVMLIKHHNVHYLRYIIGLDFSIIIDYKRQQHLIVVDPSPLQAVAFEGKWLGRDLEGVWTCAFKCVLIFASIISLDRLDCAVKWNVSSQIPLAYRVTNPAG